MTLSRRKILGAGSLAMIGTALQPGRALARPVRADVIIIGSGFAGLNAALQLREQGLRVVVLEAAARPGGRSQTAYHLDSRIELGAVQIGPMYARVRDLAQRLGVKLGPGAHINAPYSFVLGDRLIGAKDWAASPHNPLEGKEREVPPQGLNAFYVERRSPFEALDDWLAPRAAQFDVSLAEWLRVQQASPAAQRLIDHTLGNPGLQNVGLLRMLQEATRSRADVKAVASMPGMEGKDVFERFALTSSHVIGGNSVLTDRMGAELGDALQLRRKVVQIDLDPAGCEVRCADGSRWQGRRVIAALPFAALRNVDITPSLAGSQGDAVRRMHYNNQSQVWLRVKAPYWEADGLEASMWTDGPFSLIRQQLEYDGKRELISALSFGNKSRAVDALAPAERGRLAIEYIERVRPSTRGKLEFLGVHSWAQDPLQGGCSHALLPWRGAAWAATMARPYHQMHFAGEHTRRLEVGMEAAMETGERAALEVLESLS
jgi:monoamine oxidase